MEKISGLFGGGSAVKAAQRQQADIRDAQAAQQAVIDQQSAETEAKESALRRLFRGGAGRRLSGEGGLAQLLGG